MKKLMLGFLLVLPIMVGSAYAADNPDTNASDKNYDTNQPNSIPGGMQKAEDAGNRGMNKVDEGVHKGIHKSKKTAHKAKSKSKDTYDKAMAPAKEPATTSNQ